MKNMKKVNFIPKGKTIYIRILFKNIFGLNVLHVKVTFYKFKM